MSILKSQKGFSLIELRLSFTMIVLLLFVLALFRGAFVDENSALRALNKQGYSEAKITDRSWFLVGMRGCDGSDAAKFTAEAINPAGKQVTVFVCEGWPFKGATIRTD